MVIVRITPLDNDYFGEVEILNQNLNKKEIKEIEYKLNTYWIGGDDYKRDVEYRREYYDNDKCIVEFPKSCFINNNGGYNFKDVVEEIITPANNIIFEQISSVITDVDIIQWVFLKDLEDNEMELENYEDEIRNIVREIYDNIYDDDLKKFNLLFDCRIDILHEIGYDVFSSGGWFYIYKDAFHILEDNYEILKTINILNQ